MSILSFFGCGKKAPEYPADTLTTRDGTQITITFFRHASLSVEAGGKYIYVDPVSGYADYAALPKADVVLITHSHYDHLDVAAVEAIQTPQTEILCDRTSAEAFEMNCYTMRPGSVATPRDYLKVEAVAAYNTTDGHLQFHPKEREDCGYVLTIGGSRIYIAGDTEPTPELKALKNIDIAFLPVNQPYTMTVDQAVEAVKAIRPTIFYPYHYGEVEEKTDIDRLVREFRPDRSAPTTAPRQIVLPPVRRMALSKPSRPRCAARSPAKPKGVSPKSGILLFPSGKAGLFALPADDIALDDKRNDQSDAAEAENRPAVDDAPHFIRSIIGTPVQQHEGEEQPETDAQQKATGLQGSGHPARHGTHRHGSADPHPHRYELQVVDQSIAVHFINDHAALATAHEQFEELVDSQRNHAYDQGNKNKIHHNF